MKLMSFKGPLVVLALCLISLKGVAQDWEVLSQMPTPRFNLAAEVVGNRIYALGGVRHSPTNSTISYSKVEEYDPKTDKWSEKSSMPTARFSFATAVYQERIFTFGGNKQNAPFSSVEVYDAKTDQWFSKNEMPIPRSSASAVTLNNFIYVFGGNVFGGEESSFVERYDPVNDHWTRLKDMPHARSSHVSIAVNNKIYIIGGKSKGNEYSQGFVLDVDEYDPSTDQWTKKSNIPTPRFQFSAVALNNKIYLVSGRDVSGISKSVDVYDPSLDSWSTTQPLPEGVSGTGSVTISDAIYVVGGRSCVPECTRGVLFKSVID